ncbi:thylakoid membrane slr0575-like protein, partial [Tanacetum coccineum]
MKALTATTTGGGVGNILCSHRLNLSGNHQIVSFNLLRSQDQLVERSRSYLKFKLVIAKAADSPVPATAATGGKSIVEDDEFSLAKVSFGVIGLGLGVSLLS